MTAIRVDFDASQLERTLGSLTAKERLGRALSEIGDAVVASVQLSFRDSVDPYGVPWAPLSEVTLEKRRGSSAQILVDTGRLRNTVNSSRVSGDSVIVAASVIYAATQQFGAKQGQFGRGSRGGPTPWGDVPARPFFPVRDKGLPKSLKAEIDEIISEAIRGNL